MEHYGQLDANEFDNLIKMEKFFERHKALLRKNNPLCPTSIKEI